jgi:hypothetical protein
MVMPIIAPASHDASGRFGGPAVSLLLRIIVDRLLCLDRAMTVTLRMAGSSLIKPGLDEWSDPAMMG